MGRFFLSTVIIGGAALALHIQGGCIVRSVCLVDSDCEYPRRCNSNGDCEIECSVESAHNCPEQRPLCMEEEYRCVVCLRNDDCVDDDDCVAGVCVPGAAPRFALVDRNPASATFEDTLALESYAGNVVLLFFAGLG